MLDKDGYISEANGVNVFSIRRGVVYTPHADYCLPGITRQTILDICRDNDIPCQEKRLSLTEFYTADEVLTTGTMGELTKVASIDGRDIVNKSEGSVLDRLKQLFRELTATKGTPIA